MANKIRERFITQKCLPAQTGVWKYATLLDYQAGYRERCLLEAFNLLVDRLRELQLCLPCLFRSDDLLKNCVLNVCVGVKACRLARKKVAPTVMGVIADFQTSISTH